MYELTEILPAASGERILLRLISDSGEAVTVNISCKTYSELALKKGELSDSVADKLLTEADFEKAVIKGMNILGFGANSAQTLKTKLAQKGFSPSTAEKAVRYLKDRGYIDETKDVLRLCESMLKKKYGQKRILSALRAKGYGHDAINKAEKALADVDFTENCVELIKIKFKQLPKDRPEMQKAIAKLVALGYNVGEIKNALRIAAGER
jgi:SOS response regulatory protein OraA/RecX